MLFLNNLEFAVCASPYVLAFNSEGFEIRLLVNGNLVYAGSMPHMKLITSKTDILFATTAPEYYPWPSQSGSGREATPSTGSKEAGSGPSSPNCKFLVVCAVPSLIQRSVFVLFQTAPNLVKKPFRVYKVSLASLTGQPKECPVSRVTPPSPNNQNGRGNLPAISVNNDFVPDRDSATPSPTFHEDFRLHNQHRRKIRTDTASTDSGIQNSFNSVSSISSPPASPL
jgi:hypothetical protein